MFSKSQDFGAEGEVRVYFSDVMVEVSIRGVMRVPTAVTQRPKKQSQLE